jgi:hypothetical protein
MKKMFFAAAFIFAAQFVIAQGSDKYIAAMTKNLQAIDSAFRNPSSLVSLSNNFERIATAEKTQWLPYYYAAFCQVNYGFMETDKSKVDGFADKATELIEKAAALSPGNSEISCIKSMIASCHMMVDPMQRWQQYGAQSSQALEEAKQQDATNPRPDYLIGQGLKYTPEQFGGGCKTAVPQLEAAMKKFETFKPASPMHPNWGKEITAQIISECSK